MRESVSHCHGWKESSPPPGAGAESLPDPRFARRFSPCLAASVWTTGNSAGAERMYEITPHLKVLEPLRSEFLLLENLWNAQAVRRNGH